MAEVNANKTFSFGRITLGAGSPRGGADDRFYLIHEQLVNFEIVKF